MINIIFLPIVYLDYDELRKHEKVLIINMLSILILYTSLFKVELQPSVSYYIDQATPTTLNSTIQVD